MQRKKYKSNQNQDQVRIEFTGKKLTSWGGIASLLAKYLNKIQFRKWVESHIPIQEESNNSCGVYSKVMSQFLTVLCGGDRFSHMEHWYHSEAVFKECFGIDRLPKSSSGLTRFWNKVDSYSLSENFLNSCRRLAISLLRSLSINSDDLRFDSSVITRYGHQQGARKGYNPKKPGRVSHQPQIGFLGSGIIVNLWNRSGNIASSNGIVEFFKQTIHHLGSNFIVQRVLGDSGYYKIEFIKHLEEHGYVYIISVPICPILQRTILDQDKWHSITEGIEACEFYFEHKDRKWDKLRRYVAIRQEVEVRPQASGKQIHLFPDLIMTKKYRYHLLITNETSNTPEDVWGGYRPRANDENVIKDLKDGYGFAAFCLQNFWATEAIMAINALIFHNLIHYFNKTILNPKHAIQKLKTIRMKYLIIPAILGKDGRVPVLRLGISKKKVKKKILQILENIKVISFTMNCNAVEVYT